jgi:hypothetical protein
MVIRRNVAMKLSLATAKLLYLKIKMHLTNMIESNVNTVQLMKNVFRKMRIVQYVALSGPTKYLIPCGMYARRIQKTRIQEVVEKSWLTTVL